MISHVKSNKNVVTQGATSGCCTSQESAFRRMTPDKAMTQIEYKTAGGSTSFARNRDRNVSLYIVALLSSSGSGR